jgi:hypothetical protein
MPHLDLELQELHILRCRFKHSADIYLPYDTNFAFNLSVSFRFTSVVTMDNFLFQEAYFGSIWYKVLQYPEPFVDPFSSFLHPINTSISNFLFS